MPEENKTDTTPEAPPSTPPEKGKTPEPEGTGQDTFDRAYVEKLRRQAAGHRVAASQWQEKAQTLEQRVAGLEDSLKSQFEGTLSELKASIEAEKTARIEAERRATRLQVATQKGLPPELADRLRGESVEELEADADVLLGVVGKGRSLDSLLPPQRQAPPGVGSPSAGKSRAQIAHERRKQGTNIFDPEIHKSKGGGVE